MAGRFPAAKVHYDGYTFDSAAERNYYIHLKELLLKGEITNLEIHPSYLLQEAFEHKGKKIKAITYEADFSYNLNNLEQEKIVVDVKGFTTEEFKLKHKMFLKAYPNLTLEIMRSIGKGEWVEDKNYRSEKKNRTEQALKRKLEVKMERFQYLSQVKKLTTKQSQELEKLKEELGELTKYGTS